MKHKYLVPFSLLFIVIIMGCTQNNQVNNELAARENRDEFTRVRYERPTSSTPEMEVADNAAERIVALKEISHAEVLVVNKHSYAAVKLVGTVESLTPALKQKIVSQIKNEQIETNRVYISANADVYTQTAKFTEHLRAGRPIELIFDDFSEMVRNHFPNQHAQQF